MLAKHPFASHCASPGLPLRKFANRSLQNRVGAGVVWSRVGMLLLASRLTAKL